MRDQCLRWVACQLSALTMVTGTGHSRTTCSAFEPSSIRSSPVRPWLPITTIAQETTGRAITANTVALGILVELTGIVSKSAISQAVAARAPKGTKEMNQSALEAGFAAARGEDDK